MFKITMEDFLTWFVMAYVAFCIVAEMTCLKYY